MTEVRGRTSEVSKSSRRRSKTKKVFCFAQCTVLFALCFTAEAQPPKKVARIGFLSGRGEPTPTTLDPTAAAFRQGLRDLGYIEGKNILVEYRYAAGMQDRWPGLVAELMQLKVDVLVSPVGDAIRAAKQATSAIPIVMMITADPVAAGLVDSLARPGGNVTGLTRLTVDLSGKRLELVKEVVPKISRVGVLWDPTGTSIAFKEYEAAAPSLKIQLQSLEVRGPNLDLESTFQAATKGRVTALIVVRTGVLIVHRKQIADLAIKNQLPSMHEATEEVEAGGLMSYSANEAVIYRRAATYVDKILKGAKPANLPVEQARDFEFVINLKTAKALGLTISPNVLARADRVIK